MTQTGTEFLSGFNNYIALCSKYAFAFCLHHLLHTAAKNSTFTFKLSNPPLSMVLMPKVALRGANSAFGIFLPSMTRNQTNTTN